MSAFSSTVSDEFTFCCISNPSGEISIELYLLILFEFLIKLKGSPWTPFVTL